MTKPDTAALIASPASVSLHSSVFPAFPHVPYTRESMLDDNMFFICLSTCTILSTTLYSWPFSIIEISA